MRPSALELPGHLLLWHTFGCVDVALNAEIIVCVLVARNNLQWDCHMAKQAVATRTSVQM